MNEFLFVCHIALVIFFALGAMRLGKEALSGWIALQALLANLFVMKQMCLFGFHVTCSDVFAVGSIMGLNILQESYGKDAARKTSWICFYFMLFFALASQLHLLYEPSPFDTSQPAFVTLFSQTPRLLFASIVVFFLVQRFDMHFWEFLKNHLRSWVLRNFFALLASQFLDTVLFSFIGLFGVAFSLFDVIFVSFLLKTFLIGSLSLASAWIKAPAKETLP